MESSGGFKINFKSEGDVPDVEIKKQWIVIRIIRGILQNAIKHSHATKMDVQLTFMPGQLSIVIKDDRVGFDLGSVDQKSNGLQNIMNRCRILKATTDIESNIGGGTSFLIQMPVE